MPEVAVETPAGAPSLPRWAELVGVFAVLPLVVAGVSPRLGFPVLFVVVAGWLR